MLLKNILERLEYELITGNDNVDISTLVYDSRKVEKNSVFVCISGTVSDGHSYVEQVIDAGAAAVIIEKDINIEKCKEINQDIVIIKTKDNREALALMASDYFGNPASKLKTIGITGTKGKTTTTYIVKSMLEGAGHKVGMIGTIEVVIGDKKIKSKNTTPESYVIQEYFAEMVKAGCDCVVMEVSSQGLMMKRVAGIEFDFGIFTNLSPDHIGGFEHKNFEDYMHCKSLLFKQCKLGIINIDDSHANEVIEGHRCEIETFGFSEKADLRAENVRLFNRNGSMGVDYDVKGLMDFEVSFNTPGKFSVYNSLTAIAIGRHFDVPIDVIKRQLLEIKVKGRVEMVPVGGRPFTVIIDYAHNHVSMESLFETIVEYNPKRIVTVFGAGGNRDKTRRYDMGEISGKYSSLSVLTTDNPRTEDPNNIVNDIIVGVNKSKGKYKVILDRREAIRDCIKNAQEGDVIMLVGKGHESYQDIMGEKIHFDERQIVAEAINDFYM